MEFIDGTKPNDVYESNKDEFDKKFHAKNVLDSYLQQLFIDGFSMVTLTHWKHNGPGKTMCMLS